MTIQPMLASVKRNDEPDALDLLERDHAAVTDLFDTYASLESADQKEALVSRIILELTIHGRVEEELFLPTLRRALGVTEVMDEANVGHAMMRQLMADLHGSKADAWRYDAKVKTLSELVKRHVKEEQRQIFAEARDSGLNLSAIGRQLVAYKAVLQSRYELDTSGQELAAFLAITTRKPRNSIRSAGNPSSPSPGNPSSRSAGNPSSVRKNGRSRSRERNAATVSAQRRTRTTLRVVA